MFTITSLFAGMGGIDVGFAEDCVVHRESVDDEFIDHSKTTNVKDFVVLKRLPFVVEMQNDIMKCARTIAELNGWAHGYVLEDVRKLIEDDYAFPHSDVISGGFPCQDFSILNPVKRQGFASDRGTLYRSFVEIVKRARPKLFIAENVKGMLSMPGVLETIKADFASVGYIVAHQLIKCEEFGIPQNRHRVIIMGLRADLASDDMGDDWNIITKNKRTVPCGKYFEHLDEPAESADPAQQYYSKCKSYNHRSSNEIDLATTTPTIRANHHGNIEFRRKDGGVNGEDHLQQRRMTVRETALLQTFPPNTIFYQDGNRPTGTPYCPIGNAVPPLLGYLIADKVAEILSKTNLS